MRAFGSSVLATSLLLVTASAAATVETLVLSGSTDDQGNVLAAFGTPAATRATKVAFQGTASAILTKSGTTFAVVVETGDPLPAPLTGTFNTLFEPSINGSGDVAFRATVNTTATERQGIFVATTGGIATVDLTGVRPRPPDINSAGDLVYETTSGLELWDSTGMTSTVVVALGAAAPGGGTISRFGDRVVLNDSGVVAFEAEVSGGDEGIFTWDSVNGIVAVAQQGAPTPLGGTYAAFAPAQAVSINGGGLVAFTANLNGASADFAVLLYDPSGPSTTVIAAEGDVVGGGAGALTGLDDEYVGVNGAGDVAFEGRFGGDRRLVLASGGLTAITGNLGSGAREFAPRLTTADRIVWNIGPEIQQYDGAVTTVISTADTTPFGTGLRSREPNINDPGTVVFRAVSSGRLHLLDRGTVEVVAERGGPSPGTGTFTAISEHALRRRLVFSAADTAGGLLVQLGRSGLEAIVTDADSTPLGGTFDLLGLGGEHALDVAGRSVLFQAGTIGGSAPSGVFRRNITNGTTTAVASEGGTAPNAALFTTFDGVWTAGRQSVFRASLDDGNDGVFIAAPSGTVSEIALTGDVAPGAGAGTFETFGQVATSGTRVLFSSTISGGTATDGIFQWHRGTVSKLVLDGETGLGGLFVIDALSTQLAQSGRNAAFIGALDTGASGIFLSRNGVLESLVLVGDAIPDGGTLSALDLGEPISLIRTTAVFEASASGAGGAAGLFSAKP